MRQTNQWSEAQMRRGVSSVSIAVLLLVVLVLVFAQVWILPPAAERVAAVFPETRPLVAPAIIWGVVATVCWQAVALIGVRIIVLARQGRFGPSAYGWLWAMIGCLLAFIVIVVWSFIALSVMGYGTPAMLGLLASGFIALLVAGSLGVFLVARR